MKYVIKYTAKDIVLTWRSSLPGLCILILIFLISLGIKGLYHLGKWCCQTKTGVELLNDTETA